MSGRGRGGRGGWRGRGRGGQPGGPVARDDEGNVLLIEQSGPPQLYPDIKKLPELPKITSKEERLLTRRHMLLDFYHSKASPYYLAQAEVKSSGGMEDTLRRYNGVNSIETEAKRPKLTQVLTLEPTYFPMELYSTTQQRLSTRAQSSAAQSEFFKAQASSKGLSRLDQLANMEKIGGTAAEEGKSGRSGGAKDGDAAQEEDDAPYDEQEEEEYDEEDDYLQGEAYDDDEGYDDPYDDGDGEAYF